MLLFGAYRRIKSNKTMSEPYYDSGNPYESPPPDPEPDESIRSQRPTTRGTGLGVAALGFAGISFFLFLHALDHAGTLPMTAVFSVFGLYVGFKGYRAGGDYIALAAMLLSMPAIGLVLMRIYQYGF